MDFKIRTNISKEYKDAEIIINAAELNEDIQLLINNITNMQNNLKNIIGSKDNNMFVIDVNEVICVFTEEKNVYCKTSKDKYKIRLTLSDLEQSLPQSDFIRISNSCIINIKYVEYFDTNIVGSIIVKFKDGSTEYVSKRKVSTVLRYLKGR